MRGGRQRIPHFVEMPRNAEVKTRAPEQKWPPINKEIALRKMLTVNLGPEQGNLGILA